MPVNDIMVFSHVSSSVARSLLLVMSHLATASSQWKYHVYSILTIVEVTERFFVSFPASSRLLRDQFFSPPKVTI